MEAAGLGQPGASSSEAKPEEGVSASAIDLPSGKSAQWLDETRGGAESADSRDAFAVIADVVLALLSRAETLTQEAANAALRASSQFLSVEGLKTLLGPAESLAAGRALPTDDDDQDDDMEMGGSGDDDSNSESGSDSDSDSDSDSPDGASSGKPGTSKDDAMPSKSPTAATNGDASSDDDSDDDDLD